MTLVDLLDAGKTLEPVFLYVFRIAFAASLLRMSVLILESGNTMKYSLNPQDIPLALPSGFPLGSGYISSYILPLVLYRYSIAALLQLQTISNTCVLVCSGR